MAIESLEKRRRKLAELRDSGGNPIDIQSLASQRFLTDPSASVASLTKARMGSDSEKDALEKAEYRTQLAQACENLADLLDKFRPLCKGRQANQWLIGEQELRDCARRLRLAVQKAQSAKK